MSAYYAGSINTIIEKEITMRLHQLTESPVTGDIIEFEFGDTLVECVYRGHSADGDIIVETSATNQDIIQELNNIQEDMTDEEIDEFHRELDQLIHKYLGHSSTELDEAEYQGRKVTLNKPIRTGTDEPKKFKVYVKDGDKVKMVRFGHQGGGKNKDSKTMKIKKSDPKRRKSFRARHNCDNPGPKTKARYWSCKAW